MIIKAPKELSNTDRLNFKFYLNKSPLFLGGGISGCPDWQATIENKLSEKFIVLNPRQENWNINAYADDSIKQIIWEHKHLQMSEVILFWFPKETLCPITLFELGKYLMTDKTLHIGTHPEYARRLDVEVQANLVRPNTKIWSNLQEMIDFIIDELSN